MKLVFVLLSFAAVLYAVAEDEKCFKYGLTSTDCNTGEAKIQHLRADSGPPGNDGEKGKPCQSSNGHEALKKALEDSAQSINNNWKRFQDILKMMDQLKNTCVKAANIGQSHSSGGGNTGGGFTDEGKVKHNNWKYQYFDYSATAIEAWEMCQERGGQLAFVNLLTPDERKKTFKKLKIKENTMVWVNGVAMYQPSPIKLSIYLGFLEWSRVIIPQKDFYRRFGFSSFSKSWWNHHATPGCLKCQTSNCRIANGYSETAKVICQYPFTILPASAKWIIPFTQKLNFEDARTFCERIGGQLAFNFIKNPKSLREVLKQTHNSNGWTSVFLHGEYWIGGYLVDGTANTYRYLDGTSLGDPAKFPWMRPRYPGYKAPHVINYFLQGSWRTSWRFDKHSFRNHFFRINQYIRQAMAFQVIVNPVNKSVKYGVKTDEARQFKKILCEFTKPPGSQYTTDIIGGAAELQ